jgi:hypothetical protein
VYIAQIKRKIGSISVTFEQFWGGFEQKWGEFWVFLMDIF